VTACKRSVQSQPTTSANAKVHLEEICEKASGAPTSDPAKAGEVLQALLAALSR
jgi:hypothetical protein